MAGSGPTPLPAKLLPSLLAPILALLLLTILPSAALARGILDAEPAWLFPYPGGQGIFTLDYAHLPQGDRLFTLPRLDLVLGLGGRAEFGIRIATAKRFSKSLERNEFGLSRFELSTKIALSGPVGWEEGRPAYAVILSAKVPSEDKNKGLGEDKTDLFGRLAMSGPLGRGSYTLNLGMGILQKESEVSGQDDILIWSGAVELPIRREAALLVELGGNTSSTRGPRRNFLTLGVGIGPPVGRRVELGARIGLSGETENWRLLASYRLPLDSLGMIFSGGGRSHRDRAKQEGDSAAVAHFVRTYRSTMRRLARRHHLPLEAVELVAEGWGDDTEGKLPYCPPRGEEAPARVLITRELVKPVPASPHTLCLLPTEQGRKLIREVAEALRNLPLPPRN